MANRYHDITIQLQKNSIRRSRITYWSLNSRKQVLEVYFQVIESSGNTTLGDIQDFLQEQFIGVLNRFISNVVHWNKIDLFFFIT